MFTQGTPRNHGFSDLRAYWLTALHWNPEQDSEALAVGSGGAAKRCGSEGRRVRHLAGPQGLPAVAFLSHPRGYDCFL